MDQSVHLRRAATVLALPIAGIVGLILFEVIRALSTQTDVTESLPPASMLIGMLCIFSVPVVFLNVSASSTLRWISFGIAVLGVLFHAMHILEHIMVSDFAITSLIVFTMFLPSLVGAQQLWVSRAYREK
ncbi:MAG: hypothetical protein AAF438_03410 [Pseudomonadota bacterium]